MWTQSNLWNKTSHITSCFLFIIFRIPFSILSQFTKLQSQRPLCCSLKKTNSFLPQSLYICYFFPKYPHCWLLLIIYMLLKCHQHLPSPPHSPCIIFFVPFITILSLVHYLYIINSTGEKLCFVHCCIPEPTAVPGTYRYSHVCWRSKWKTIWFHSTCFLQSASTTALIPK